MKAVLLSTIKDGSQQFKLSNRKSGANYTSIKRVSAGGKTLGFVITSTSSNRSSLKPGKTKVYITS